MSIKATDESYYAIVKVKATQGESTVVTYSWVYVRSLDDEEEIASAKEDTAAEIEAAGGYGNADEETLLSFLDLISF